MSKIARRVPRLWDEWPLVGAMERSKYDRSFESLEFAGCFRGVYPTMASAAAAAPKGQPIGYNHPAAARMYSSRDQRRFPCDYPPMFWLSKLLGSGVRKVFDVGGHIGVAFYGYQGVVDFPPDLRWLVHDVPAVVERGEARAITDDPTRRLQFTDRFSDSDGAELLFASGSLQYLELELSSLLEGLRTPPAHLLVNQFPVHETETFWTLQNIGTGYCPYRILSDRDALDGLMRLGYSLVDSWQNAEKSCHIPFHGSHSLDYYTGFLMTRHASPPGIPAAERPRLTVSEHALDGGRAR